jgi:hypothetical protein
MPHTDFESQVIQDLGEIKATIASYGKSISRLFEKLEGNGQPGLISRVIHLETNCAAVQNGKKERAEAEAAEHSDKDQHSFARIGFYIGVCSVVSSFIVVGLDHLLAHIFK